MKDSLVIVAGKTYLTRDGRKVTVILTDLRTTRSVLTRVDDGNGFEQTLPLLPSGRWSNSFDSGVDLVKEYVEPRKPREAWILCGPEGVGSLSYESETEAYDLGGGDGTETAVLFREVLPDE